MLHPGVVQSVGEVVPSVRTSRLLSVLGCVHCHLGLDHQVLELHGLHKVSVPDVATIADSDVGDALRNVVKLLAALLQVVLSTEDSGVFLHGLLHVKSNLGSGAASRGEAKTVQVGDAFFTSVSGELTLGLAWLVVLAGGLSGTTAEDDQVEERVGSETVGTVDGGASGFTTCEQTANQLVVALGVLGQDLCTPVRWDATHVVMDGGQDGDRLLRGIDTCKDVSSLEDTWESLVDLLGWQVVQVKVDMVGVGTDTTTLEDFHSHGARDDIARCEILGVGSVALHESLSLAVTEDATLTTTTLSHEAASTVNTSWMELDEFGILNREASSGNHTTTVASACMGASAGEVSSAVATSGHDRLVGLHPMDGTISHVVGHDATALITVHEQVHGEVLHEEDAVVAESTTEQGVQHGVTGTVSDGAASVGLTSLSVVSGLSTEGTLVDLALRGTAKRHAVRLELTHGNRSLTRHVLNGILVTKPVRALHSVVEVVPPVILVHVSESSVDTSLGSDSMGSCREKFGNASSLETSFGETECSL